MDNFDDMNLREELLRGIYAYGFEKPSAIQQRAIIPCIKGNCNVKFMTCLPKSTTLSFCGSAGRQVEEYEILFYVGEVFFNIKKISN